MIKKKIMNINEIMSRQPRLSEERGGVAVTTWEEVTGLG